MTEWVCFQQEHAEKQPKFNPNFREPSQVCQPIQGSEFHPQEYHTRARDQIVISNEGNGSKLSLKPVCSQQPLVKKISLSVQQEPSLSIVVLLSILTRWMQRLGGLISPSSDCSRCSGGTCACSASSNSHLLRLIFHRFSRSSFIIVRNRIHSRDK